MKVTPWAIHHLLNSYAQCIVPLYSPRLDIRRYYKFRIKLQNPITDAFGTIIVGRLDGIVNTAKFGPEISGPAMKLKIADHDVLSVSECLVKDWICSWATKRKPLQLHEYLEAHVIKPEAVVPDRVKISPLLDLGRPPTERHPTPTLYGCQNRSRVICNRHL